ncbi:PD-(D/E)XK nuclease family protein [bacterium]|nr:PD-(D/E)XK nuclease family protein [bacterium]MBU1993206.1 PD-(D/E)XK nuclease family protein [bacterium]
MNETTIVLPSARAIRHEQLKLSSSTLFLPNYITMSEFVSKLCVVKDFSYADDDTRVLLLLEASHFNSFAKLQIERNFFTFTKNSTYIFKFFEELSAEMYDIEKLDTSDIYAEYEEHIIILKELYKRYEQICSERKLLDKIFLPKLYTFNFNYVKRLKKICIQVDGHLTNFELELLEKCCMEADVTLIFNTTKFNTKMQNKLLNLGIELEKNYQYEISLNDKNVIDKKKIIQQQNIVCEPFSEPILQAAFIKAKVYEYVKKGYNPEKIAVVLPDENRAEVLKIFDDKANFNFAMGEPFVNTKSYEKLYSTCQTIEQDSKENNSRLLRVGDDLYHFLFSIYYKTIEEADVVNFLKIYKETLLNKAEIKIFDEEIYNFKNILPYMKEMSVKSLLALFMQRLAARTIDDVRGGKITVMGVLETRSMEFDAVIIVDFNDSNVPKRSDKDMFLNTQIREIASLPTMNDRENLQKHYYEMLINKSKEVAISFVKSNQSSASRFLKQLNIKEKSLHWELDYAAILFERKKHTFLNEKEIILDYSFKDKKLSATKLKTFLICKRKYYYKYIQQINSHEIPKEMPQEWEIGIDVHTALKELYTKKNSYRERMELKKDLHYELDMACGNSELEKYLISMQKRRMDIFCEEEIQRFKDGWHVEVCEKNLNCEFAGITLTGIIDRVDKRGDEIFVLDYKTGNYPIYTAKNFTQATDFQLEFYYLLAQSLGKVTACGYYDLKESKIVHEAFLQEKLAVLESNIKDLLLNDEFDFKKCEDVKNCLFCEYKIICGRE